MTRIWWSAETGWTDDGPPSVIYVDDKGRIVIVPEWDDARFECNTCGRIGTADDGITEDFECPDEECCGHVHIYDND